MTNISERFIEALKNNQDQEAIRLVRTPDISKLKDGNKKVFYILLQNMVV